MDEAVIRLGQAPGLVTPAGDIEGPPGATDLSPHFDHTSPAMT